MTSSIGNSKHRGTETRRSHSAHWQFFRAAVLACFNQVNNDRARRKPLDGSKFDLRDGFSLLEVILAIAILAASMAVLGQLIQIGMTHARKAEDMTQAVILAETIMAEIVCGAREAVPETAVPCDDDENFLFSVTADASDMVGLLKVTVTVERDPESAVDPVKSELVRLVVDPEYVASLSEDAAASGSSTSGTNSASQ